MGNYVLDNDPVQVDIKVESVNITSDAFSTICFITENNTVSKRDVVVNKLEDLLLAGYTRDSKAYNFCYGVFLQGKLNNIIVRCLRSGESYVDAYLSNKNSDYYYLVLESKDIEDILSVQSVISKADSLKLIFFSSNKDHSVEVKGLTRLVYYYNDSLLSEDIVDDCWLIFEDGISVALDSDFCIESESIKATCEEISCLNSLDISLFPNIYMDGYRWNQLSSSILTFMEVNRCREEVSSDKYVVDLVELLYYGIDREVTYKDFTLSFKTVYQNSDGRIYNLFVSNNAEVEKFYYINLENTVAKERGDGSNPFTEFGCLLSYDPNREAS